MTEMTCLICSDSIVLALRKEISATLLARIAVAPLLVSLNTGNSTIVLKRRKHKNKCKRSPFQFSLLLLLLSDGSKLRLDDLLITPDDPLA